MNKNYIVWLVTGVALILSVIAITNSGQPGANGRNGRDGETLGAVSSLDGVDEPYTRIGGVATYYGSQAFTATSSNVCLFRNPYTSTSTIRSFTANIIGAGLPGTVQFDLSTSTSFTSYGASSSPAIVLAHAVVGSAADSFVWTGGLATSSVSSARLLSNVVGAATTDVSSPYFLRPNEVISWRIATGTAGTYTTPYSGQCKIVIQSLQ